MFFSVKVLADSAALGKPLSSRLTTLELTYPRIIHSEFMTHRSHSRNAASSRAIPISRMIRNVKETPFVPIHWGSHQSGMVAGEQLSTAKLLECREIWLAARDSAVASAEALSDLRLHKQIANRLLEPWMWITVIATSNYAGWSNFFKLRCAKDAEPHIRKVANMAMASMAYSYTKPLAPNEWHLPLVGFEGDEELDSVDKVKVAVGRCARVSYLTHAGLRDTSKDIELHDRLQESAHWSPFEHVAQFQENADPKNTAILAHHGFSTVRIFLRNTLK